MILVTGANGQLGSDVCLFLQREGTPHLGVDVDVLDITDAAAVDTFFSAHPDIDGVIHCAAYTAVDKAEDDAAHCFAVNVTGTENLVKAAQNCKFLYVSSDYVFGSNGDRPLETDDEKHPQSVYAKTKLRGEDAVRTHCKRHFIVRTSWVFGEKHTNFIATMLRLSKTHDTVRVVDDQIGAPTYAQDLAALLCQMMKTDRYGTYHAANTGECSWAFLAETVFRLTEKSTRVVRVSTQDYAAKAPRPKNSRLSFRSLDNGGFDRLPPWEDAVERYLMRVQSGA